VDKQVNQNAQLKWEAVEGTELILISGGIWDCSNLLGPQLGQLLEDRRRRREAVASEMGYNSVSAASIGAG
jgi:hypothetical protein